MTKDAQPGMSSLHDWGLLLDEVQTAVRGDLHWESRLTALNTASNGLHLVVFVEPYLAYLLEGKKTVESRFARRRCPPYGYVHTGDILLLKRSGGPIAGLCEVAEVWFYRLDPASWKTIRTEFTQALCAQDPGFWQARQAASFATLMRITAVRALPPIECRKRDRRGWVVLRRNAGSEEVAK